MTTGNRVPPTPTALAPPPTYTSKKGTWVCQAADINCVATTASTPGLTRGPCPVRKAVGLPNTSPDTSLPGGWPFTPGHSGLSLILIPGALVTQVTSCMSQHAFFSEGDILMDRKLLKARMMFGFLSSQCLLTMLTTGVYVTSRESLLTYKYSPLNNSVR